MAGGRLLLLLLLPAAAAVVARAAWMMHTTIHACTHAHAKKKRVVSATTLYFLR